MKRRFPYSPCLFVLLAGVALLLSLPVPTPGQDQPPAPSNGEEIRTLTPEEAANRIDNVESRLADLKKRAPGDTIPADDILHRRNALIALQNIYRRYIALGEKGSALKSDLDKLGTNGETRIREELAQKPPFNLSLYDQYLDKLLALNQQHNAQTTSAGIAKGGLEAAQGQALEEEKRLRRLNEAKERAGEDVPERLLWDLQGATLDHEIARATVTFQEANLENLKRSLEILSINRDRMGRTVRWIGENLAFDQADLDRILAKSTEGIEKIKEEIPKLSSEREEIEKSYFRAQARAEQTTSEDKAQVAQAALEAMESRRLSAQRRLEKAQLELTLSNTVQKIWIARYDLLREEVATENLWKEQEKAEQLAEELQQNLISTQQFQNSLQARRSDIQQKLELEGISTEQLRHVREERKTLDAMTETNLDAMSLLLRAGELNNRLLEELESRLGSIQITKRVSAFGKQRFLELWRAELWASNGHAVTLGKLIVALLLVTLGTLFSRRMARLVRKKLLVRFDMDVDVAESAERLLFYVLIIIFILSSLKMVNIPLTAFAFLGGAVAIGFGFGAQKFFSNLISGFLIMAQKPFRINDVIAVDDTLASVKSVGSRYTRVQTFDNLDLLVPNSYLLDNKIVNWTLSDKIIRQKITVGADYDSDARQVERLLLQAVREHVKVLPSPEPFVVFRDFGDSALVFDVLFWVNLDVARSFFAASDIRYRIMELFREAEIVIAFPQTDVHLDVNGPVEVRMTRSGRREDSPPPPQGNGLA